jgi:hypothetical protein
VTPIDDATGPKFVENAANFLDGMQSLSSRTATPLQARLRAQGDHEDGRRRRRHLLSGVMQKAGRHCVDGSGRRRSSG